MAPLGTLPVGSTANVQLLLDNAASDEATLIVAYTRSGGTNAETDSDVAAPGGATKKIAMALPAVGIVGINVQMAAPTDTGQLVVNGKVTPITGDFNGTLAVV